MESKLWTKDYTLLTVTTILSAIGGEAITFPLSLLVFDETGSPFLSAIIFVASFAPDIILAVLIAPLVEKWNKKKLIIVLDTLLLVLYLFLAVYMYFLSFNYMIMLLFTLITSTISIIYSLAYQAWLPDIIPVGFEQKGNAVGSTIYPFITMAMAPLSAWAYKNLGIANIFFFVAGLLAISIVLEAQIKCHKAKTEDEQVPSWRSAFSAYKNDLVEGVHYFRSIKGLRNIGVYMGVTNGCSAGITQMTQYYFQTHPVLNVIMLGTLKTAQMLGRVIGGVLQYRFEIPPQKRFAFTKLVYLLYDSIDTILLFLPFPAMLGLKFTTGGLGTSSAIIRSTAYQNFLPRNMRARVASINSLLFSVGMATFYLLSGLLAEYLSYRTVAVGFGVFQLIAMYLLIIRPGKDNRVIYEADRTLAADACE
ncbi:MAG TPA: MFS transporter [Clostridiaceae bacterium]|nr:MFS transporter [Clostridiaceae bacterium]